MTCEAPKRGDYYEVELLKKKKKKKKKKTNLKLNWRHFKIGADWMGLSRASHLSTRCHAFKDASDIVDSNWEPLLKRETHMYQAQIFFHGKNINVKEWPYMKDEIET